jgi:hypothetical protein
VVVEPGLGAATESGDQPVDGVDVEKLKGCWVTCICCCLSMECSTVVPTGPDSFTKTSRVICLYCLIPICVPRKHHERVGRWSFSKKNHHRDEIIPQSLAINYLLCCGEPRCAFEAPWVCSLKLSSAVCCAHEDPMENINACLDRSYHTCCCCCCR